MRIKTETLIRKYKDNLFAVAFNVCKSADDAEDVVQDTFVSYHTGRKDFQNEEHIKAWLIRVAINRAINVNRSFWRKKSVPLDDYVETLTFETPEAKTLFTEVMRLPEKYRVPLHLFYYEDYSISDIAKLLSISENNVKVRLSRARKALKDTIAEEWDDEQ